jgi:hypothetical protein
MQIFVLDANPVRAAFFLDDARVIKMCTESAQILCTVISMDGHETPLKPTHHHHPCVQWAWDPVNRFWLFKYWCILALEYRARFGKVHKMEQYMEFIGTHIKITDKEPSSFCNLAQNTSLGLDFTGEIDTILAYRKYISKRWETAKVPARYYRQVLNTNLPTWHPLKAREIA